MADYQTIDIDSIADNGATVPEGTYTYRLKDTKGTESKSKLPMVIAEFEVTKGEFEGFTTPIFFCLLKKDGTPNTVTILEFKRILTNIENPLPKGFCFPLDADAAAKILKKYVGNKKITGTVTQDGKYQRLKITGPAVNVQTLGDDTQFDEDFDNGEYDEV